MLNNDDMQAELGDAIDALGRVAAAFARRRGQLAAAAGLTETQWQLLEGIATEHFLPSLFARAQRCSAAAVSRTLRQLREEGLIEAAAGGDDGRERRYRLTRKGARRLDGIRAARRDAIGRIWEDLPPAELARFTETAAALAERLEAFADEVDRGRGAGRGASAARAQA